MQHKLPTTLLAAFPPMALEMECRLEEDDNSFHNGTTLRAVRRNDLRIPDNVLITRSTTFLAWQTSSSQGFLPDSDRR